MSKMVIALFDSLETASPAVKELIDEGIQRESLSMIAGDVHGEYKDHLKQRRQIDPQSAGTGVGAVLGGLSGLLIGLGVITIPGFGAVLAAGPIAGIIAGLAGAVVGGAAGNMIGVFTQMGLSEEQAINFAEGIRRGGTVVIADVEDQLIGKAESILNRHDPVDIEKRPEDWRLQGWEGEVEPAPPSDVDGEIIYYYALGYQQGAGAFENAYRSHYAIHYSSTGRRFEVYRPAYEFGYNLGIDEGFRGKEWEDIAADAEEMWNQKERELSWDEVKDAAYFARRQVDEVLEEEEAEDQPLKQNQT